jgi:hypothetical protein
VSEATVLVNKMAQGLLARRDGISWFAARTEDENRTLLRELSILILEAGATSEDVPASIQRSGIKATVTPAVLLSRQPLRGQLAKIANLPVAEFPKAFQLFVALLAVADERRREHDKVVGCSHWWHHLA